MMNQDKTTIIIGASSEIAQAICRLKLQEQTHLILISRELVSMEYENLQWFICDYSNDSISRVVNNVKQQNRMIEQVIICNGLLHNQDFKPEKKA